MGTIKRLLFFVLILTIIVTGLYWVNNKGYLKQVGVEQIQDKELREFVQDTSEQTKTLGSRAKETSEQVQQVLGESVQVNEAEKEKAVHERAFDYGQYLYCKAVVEDWEGVAGGETTE